MSDWVKPPPQPTAAQQYEMAQVFEALEATGFETDADEASVVWWHTPSGQVQPVIWPMVLHTHGQECFRA